MTALILLLVNVAFADPWDDVLRQGNLTKSDVGIEVLEAKQVGGAEHKSPYFEIMSAEPLRIPFLTRTYRDLLFENSKNPFKIAISVMARTSTQLGIRRNLERDPLAEFKTESMKPGAVVASLDRLHRVAKKPLTGSQRDELAKKAKALSKETSEPLAFLISSIAHSIEWRDRALSELDRKTLVALQNEIMEAPRAEETEKDRAGLSQELKRAERLLDLPVLMAGGYDLVLAVQESREKFSSLKESDRFEWTTPYGRIAVRGDKKSDTSASKSFDLLVIDAGGDDTYFSGAGADLEHPVGIVIDLAGNDRYLASPGLEKVVEKPEKRDAKLKPSFAGAVFGYGILVDVDGNDVYRSYRMTQARGVFGLGFLWDLTGDDQYECWAQCQASAEFGLGFLMDGSGRDSYSSMHAAQGFAGPLGSGVLFDLGTEGDSYVAVTKPIDFPARGDTKTNLSFAQGASLGVRADSRDGHGLAGGFAALIDAGGDNSFEAGFYAQGTAYWYGVGWLSVGNGHDRYKAGKYAQATGVHFGVGILQEIGGNETYEVDEELGIGHGHDYAVGFLFDEDGDDKYKAPNFSLGCASAQGLGFFWDRRGDDTYESMAKETLGCGSLRIETPSIRTMSRTLGVFLDSGGKNRFEAPNAGLQGSITSRKWLRPNIDIPKAPKRMKDRLFGVGLVADSPGTEAPF